MVPFIELVNVTLTDSATRGGNPGSQAAPAPPPPVQKVEPVKEVPYTPPPEPQPRPEPPKVVEKVPEVKAQPKVPTKIEPKVEKPVAKEPDELAPKTKAKVPEKKEKPAPEVQKPVVKQPVRNIDLSRLVTRNDEAQRVAREKAAKEKAAREAAEASAKFRREAMAKLSGSISSIKQNTSGTVVEMPGGGGGEVYVNYKQFVQAAYHNAWIPPAEIANDAMAVRAEVTVDRSGNVISAKPVRKSGNPALDKSVERALQLKFIAPFPEGSKDNQRDFIIIFDLKARRSLG